MSVAKVYAKAFYAYCAENGNSRALSESCFQLEQQMDTVLSVITASKEARIALFGEVTTGKEKAQVIEQLAKILAVDPALSSFLVLLANKRRLKYLPEIRDEFSSVRLSAEGGLVGKLVSAEPVGEADIESLAKTFCKKLGKKVFFRVSIDPSLLAGVKVTVNGVTYDGSLQSQLQRLRDQIVVGQMT